MRWILLLTCLLAGLAQALDYQLQPRQIAEGVWLVEIVVLNNVYEISCTIFSQCKGFQHTCVIFCYSDARNMG